MQALNSSLELGIRALIILESASDPLALDELVLYDYGMLHSSDLGGPPSLHPALPARAAEFGVKRQLVEEGLQVMSRAGLTEMIVGQNGFQYVAGDGAAQFLGALESDYLRQLREVALWVVHEFRSASPSELTARLHAAVGDWLQIYIPPDRDEGTLW